MNTCEICSKECNGRTCSGSCRAKLSRRTRMQADKESAIQGSNITSCALRSKSQSGFVYIIRSGDSDHYKIGCTTSRPIKRLRNLQTGSPVELILYEVFYADDMANLERNGHNRVKSRHVRGEWFELTQAEVERLAAYLAGDTMHYYYNKQEQAGAIDANHRVSSELADYDYNDVLPVYAEQTA